MAKTKKTQKRVGILLCDTGGWLRKGLDFARLQKALKAVPAVGTVDVCTNVPDAAACASSVRSITGQNIHRIVIGGCGSDGTDEFWKPVLKRAGVNAGLWWKVPIKERCALAQAGKKAATDKAIELLLTAVERVLLAEPVESRTEKLCRDVTVVCGGVAGMQAAVSLARFGHRVSLLHRQKELGGAAGAMPELYAYLSDDPRSSIESVRRTVKNLSGQVKERSRIRVYPETTLKSVEGEQGRFQVTAESGKKKIVLESGSVVLATGANVAPAPRMKHPKIVGMSGLVDRMRRGRVGRRTAIVLDARGEQARGVTGQVLSAAELLTTGYGCEVDIYCRNMRVATMGLEAQYHRVRKAGVRVLKSSKSPKLSDCSGRVMVKTDDPVADAGMALDYDMAVMADVVANGSIEALAGMVRGFRPGPADALQADDVWLAPTLSNRPGIFVAGAARGNSEFRDALTDGLAAAGEAHALLAGKTMDVDEDAALVDKDKCVLCLTCLRICPHGAITIDTVENAAKVSDVSCRRCGICAAECPATAISLPRYSDRQVAIDVGEKPSVTVFACVNSAVPAAAAAAAAGNRYSKSVRIVEVPCAGKVDPRTVLAALERGAKRVLVLGCHPESCQYLSGSSRASKRIARVAAMLEQAGFDPSRVTFGGIAAVEPSRFLEYVKGDG